jgi:hypothetical protein
MTLGYRTTITRRRFLTTVAVAVASPVSAAISANQKGASHIFVDHQSTQAAATGGKSLQYAAFYF